MTPIQCVLDGVDFNDQTNYFLGFGANVGVADLTYSEYVGYDGTVSMYNASDAKLVDVTLPIDIKAADYSTLQTCVAALNSRIAACTWDTPKTLVFDGVSYDIVAGGQVSPTYDELYGVKVARVTVMLKRKPTSTPGGSSGTALNIAGVWANVMDFGAAGNGSTDDTAAIQSAASALSSGGTLVLPPGTYIVSNTITLSDKTRVLGNASTLKLSASPTGTLASNAIVLALDDACTVEGLGFEYPSSFAGYSCDAYSSAVYIDGKDDCVVRGCTFDLTGCIEGLDQMNAVCVFGHDAESVGALIADNVMTACGVLLTHDAKRATVRGNVIAGTPNKGIVVWSYDDAYPEGLLIDGNHLTDCGSAAIEDWGGYSVGTVITGNVIANAGDTDTLDGFGISATGPGSVVTGNSITGFCAYGIECVGGSTVRGNRIAQDAGRLGDYTAIQLNGDAGQSTTISGNAIEHVAVGIWLDDEVRSVSIDGNVFLDYGTRGIYVYANTASHAAVSVTGNSFRLASPPSDYRTAVQVENAAAGRVLFTAVGNVLAWDAACDGGTNGDRGFVTFTSDVTLIGNSLDGGGVSDPAAVIGIFGVTGSNCKYIANTLTGGATVDTSGLTTPVVTNTP